MEPSLHDRSTPPDAITPSGSRVCMPWVLETSCKRIAYCIFDLCRQTALAAAQRTPPSSAWRASTSSNNNERLSMPTPRAAALAAGTSLYVKRAHRTQQQRAHSLSASACPRLRHASRLKITSRALGPARPPEHVRHGILRHQINLLVLYFFPYIDVRATSARPQCLCTSLNTSCLTMTRMPSAMSPLTPTPTPTQTLLNSSAS